MNKYNSAFDSIDEIRYFKQKLETDTRPGKKFLRDFFYALIHIPIRWSDLLFVQKHEVSNDCQTFTIWHQASRLSVPSPRTYPIPDNLKYFFSQHNFGFVFAELVAMNSRLRNAKLKEYLKEVWPKFDIKIEEFNRFFKVYAIQNSYFKPGFIKKVLLGDTSSLTGQTQVHARINLFNWWGTAICVNRFGL